jgi:Tfp pilus assembly protein PilO
MGYNNKSKKEVKMTIGYLLSLIIVLAGVIILMVGYTLILICENIQEGKRQKKLNEELQKYFNKNRGKND